MMNKNPAKTIAIIFATIVSVLLGVAGLIAYGVSNFYHPETSEIEFIIAGTLLLILYVSSVFLALRNKVIIANSITFLILAFLIFIWFSIFV
ncbi:MAG: hypothetical protein MRY79_08640 [Alphaproteobacteria bacterium]|nr:hypothetical protein [Alphaproteobacteria bacterium]